MSAETEQKIEQAIANVKPFSQVIQKAISIIDSAKTDNREIAGVLKQEPLLAARLLSIANSPFYGMSGKIDDIESASVILGNNIIRNILLSAGALESFPATAERKNIWSHSLKVATVAEFLEKQTQQDQGKAYIVGLLHDVGKFILLDTFPEYHSLIEAENSMECDSIDEETKLLGISHALVGAKIIGKWNLPEDIQELIETHHQPSELVNSSAAALLSLADSICYQLEADLPEADILKNINNDYLVKLGSDKKTLQTMLPEIKQKMSMLDGMFDNID